MCDKDNYKNDLCKILFEVFLKNRNEIVYIFPYTCMCILDFIILPYCSTNWSFQYLLVNITINQSGIYCKFRVLLQNLRTCVKNNQIKHVFGSLACVWIAINIVQQLNLQTNIYWYPVLVAIRRKYFKDKLCLL